MKISTTKASLEDAKRTTGLENSIKVPKSDESETQSSNLVNTDNSAAIDDQPSHVGSSTTDIES
jgi:hypothetical protein